MRARRTRAETLAALALSLASASSNLLTENFSAAVGSDSDYLDARRALAICTTDLSRSRNASSGLRLALEPGSAAGIPANTTAEGTCATTAETNGGAAPSLRTGLGDRNEPWEAMTNLENLCEIATPSSPPKARFTHCPHAISAPPRARPPAPR